MADVKPDLSHEKPSAAAANSNTPLSLLERARAHDPEAWRRLVQLYEPLVLFWCAGGGLRGPNAEDVTQEVFAAAATGLDGFRRDRPGDTFRGWLRGITRNHILLHFRRAQGKAEAKGGSDAWYHLQNLPDPLPEPGADETQEVGELFRRAVEQVRCQFEPATWDVFWRTVIEGRSPAVLAEELGLSIAAIRQAKSRVLRRLKQEMGELLD
jgi:RNA polymerase sigma-70 factor (ECF subfamily)